MTAPSKENLVQIGARTALSHHEHGENVENDENTAQNEDNLQEHTQKNNSPYNVTETEPLFTPSFVTEKTAEPSLTPQAKVQTKVQAETQAEKKRFVPPILAEKNDNNVVKASSAFERTNSPVSEPIQKQETVKDIKNSFRQKILEAQKAQAESQQREFNPQTPEKIIPVDAENIIHTPLENFREDFGQEQFDYSDEEERLAASGCNDGVDISLARHLFDENTIPEEEKESLDWQAFLAYCEEHDFPVEYSARMQGVNVVLTKENCYIKISAFQAQTFNNKVKEQLENLLCTFLGRTVKIQVTIVAYELVSDEKLREKASNNSQIQMLMKEFGAEIYRCRKN